MLNEYFELYRSIFLAAVSMYNLEIQIILAYQIGLNGVAVKIRTISIETVTV